MLCKADSLSLSGMASHKILRQNKSRLLLKATNVRDRLPPLLRAIVQAGECLNAAENKAWRLTKDSSKVGRLPARVAPWYSAVVWVKMVESKYTLKVLQSCFWILTECLVVGCGKGAEDDGKSFYGGGDSVGKMFTLKAWEPVFVFWDI